MTIPPESIEAGKCYLMETGHIRRVMRILPDGRVQYEIRSAANSKARWRIDIQEGRSFAFMTEREVRCDWTPATEDP